MRFQILHETPGRIRLRADARSMSIEQADILDAWLRKCSGVDQVTVHERTCGVIVYYHGPRSELVRALETDSEQLFQDATVYIGEIENRYLTGETRRKVFHGLYKLPMVRMNNDRVLLRDGEILQIGDIKIECLLVPGHTGWTDDLDFAFLHRRELCKPFTKKYTDPSAPYDGYEEGDDTEERARTEPLVKVKTG